MDSLDLNTRWTWRTGHLVCRILEVSGGELPTAVRDYLQHASPPDLAGDSEVYHLADRLVRILIGQLSAPTPLDYGAGDPIPGALSNVQLADSRSSRSPTEINISYEPPSGEDTVNFFVIFRSPMQE